MAVPHGDTNAPAGGSSVDLTLRVLELGPDDFRFDPDYPGPHHRPHWRLRPGRDPYWSFGGGRLIHT
jgi:hypothetical protein